MSLAKSATPKPSRLKLGWIPYWNLVPLQFELARALGKDVEFQGGSPAQVNRMLAEGQVSLAPCSSVCLVKNPSSEIAMPIGVASNGPVQSVYLGIREDNGVFETVRKRQHLLKEVFATALGKHSTDVRKSAESVFNYSSGIEGEKLAYTPGLCLTPASAASANLAKVLYRLWFGPQSFELMVERKLSRGDYTCDMELLIGDEALTKRPQYRYIIDLGEVWKDLTGLPFVFAVWQCNGKSVPIALKSRVMEAAELAQARMRIEPSVYLQGETNKDVTGKPVDLAGYWRLIQYRLGPAHFKGLALYLSLVRQLNPTVVSANALTNIMKWESAGSIASV